MGVGGTVPRRVSRVQLGVLVRDYRLRAGITPRQLATEMQWHHSKVSKVETGSTTLVGLEVEKLIELLRIPDELAPRIRELGAEARRRGPLAKVPDWAQTQIDLELHADILKSYSDELIPTLLQTADYSRALMSSTVLPERVPDIEERVQERVRRADRLQAESPPHYWAVVGEAALRRTVGGKPVFRQQLEHIHELSKLHHVSFHVIPFSHGEHVAVGVTFVMVEINDPPIKFVYTEGLADAQYYDRSPHIETYEAAFGKVLSAAVDERRSRSMLEQALKELSDANEPDDADPR